MVSARRRGRARAGAERWSLCGAAGGSRAPGGSGSGRATGAQGQGRQAWGWDSGGAQAGSELPTVAGTCWRRGFFRDAAETELAGVRG